MVIGYCTDLFSVIVRVLRDLLPDFDGHEELLRCKGKG